MCIRSCKYTALFKTVGWIASELEIFMVKTTSILESCRFYKALLQDSGYIQLRI